VDGSNNQRLRESGNMESFLRCILCDSRYDVYRTDYFCPNCVETHDDHYGNIEISYDFRGQTSLPFPIQPFTVYEGNTPTVRNESLSKVSGFHNLLYKCEMVNPSASFKDRASSYMVAQALRLGKRDVVAASSGNAGVSLATYALKAGLRCQIFVPERTSKEKLELLRLLKASIVYVDGSFEDAYYASLASEDVKGAYSCHAGSNPFAMEGYKKTALEIFNQIGIPDKVIVPVGDGAFLSGIWKGFKELQRIGMSKRTPQMVAVQVKGADPVAIAFKKGLVKYVLKNPVESIAEGIVARESYNSIFAVKALRESGGFPISVTDEEIVSSLRIAVTNGMIIEPTSAAALAAIDHMRNDEKIRKDETIVCMLTGSGIKTMSEISRILS
jgi:threonine synthase